MKQKLKLINLTQNKTSHKEIPPKQIQILIQMLRSLNQYLKA